MPPKKPAADSADPPAPTSSDAPMEEKKTGQCAHVRTSESIYTEAYEYWAYYLQLSNCKCFWQIYVLIFDILC